MPARFDIRIGQETEIDRGWSFRVELGRNDEQRRFEVKLDWVDYDHWSHGGTAPAEVIRAIMMLIAERDLTDDLPERFDAARLRRLCPDLDGLMQARLP